MSVIKVNEKRYKYSVKRLFRDYDTVSGCLVDHLAILKKPGYADAWSHRNDARQFVRRIVDNIGAKYATAPNYVETMDKIFVMVEKAVKEERL